MKSPLLVKIAACLLAIGIVGLVHGQTFFRIEDPRCANRPNGYFLPDWNDCQNYSVCMNGRSTPGRCPDPFLFDAVRQMCYWADEVDCGIARCPTTGFRDIQMPGSCNQFIRCHEGYATFMECAGEMLFDTVTGTCTQPERVNCSLSNMCPSSTDPENPVFLPSPNSCEQFYVCLDGEAVQHQCDEGVHWNHAILMCDDPINANCTVGPGGTPLPPDFCPPAGHEVIGDPRDCNYFIVCVNGVPSDPQTCGEGMLWNPIMNNCDREENVVCPAP